MRLHLPFFRHNEPKSPDKIFAEEFQKTTLSTISGDLKRINTRITELQGQLPRNPAAVKKVPSPVGKFQWALKKLTNLNVWKSKKQNELDIELLTVAESTQKELDKLTTLKVDIERLQGKIKKEKHIEKIGELYKKALVQMKKANFAEITLPPPTLTAH